MSLHLGKVLLSEAGKAAPVEPGIYFICLDQAVKYDSGVTPVVYIGSSQNLRDRLRNHKRNSHNQSLILLQELYQGLIYCDLFKFSVEERDTLYAVEESALRWFHSQFGTIPLFNASVPPIPDKKRVKNPFHFGNSRSSGVITPDDLASMLYGIDLQRWTVTNRPRRADPDSKISDAMTIDEFNAYCFPGREIYESMKEKKRRAALTQAEREEEDRNERLKRFSTQEVSMWSVEKLSHMIKICDQLEPVNKNPKCVHSFRTTTPEVPSPHTWGEIAVAMAGRITGNWKPSSEIVVKIKFKREVLGEACLYPNPKYIAIFGYDMTEMPQRNSERETTSRPERPTTGWSAEHESQVDHWFDEMHSRTEKLLEKALGRRVAEDDSPEFDSLSQSALSADRTQRSRIVTRNDLGADRD